VAPLQITSLVGAVIAASVKNALARVLGKFRR
jgi:hypothetical protein